jgi:hypothetical protein
MTRKPNVSDFILLEDIRMIKGVLASKGITTFTQNSNDICQQVQPLLKTQTEDDQ